jgi:hypothetical protein
VRVFRRLFDERFPIESMRLVDEFGGDDELALPGAAVEPPSG